MSSKKNKPKFHYGQTVSWRVSSDYQMIAMVTGIFHYQYFDKTPNYGVYIYSPKNRERYKIFNLSELKIIDSYETLFQCSRA